ncbi:hypothetical protein HOP50_04g34120 [Chloropicon primus]|uniref:Uncharacterized protein n=1 Tax=Chloropicon primus TaxID=1764295 RepID=A0A5B8MMP6_9CHLO|nr:hypothetical protein A3770_04p34030 [Chloropicon primus]UPR00098.1 hypothetical protein HOP50_04g34120 [Chloropicon primus]|mmetsp:Transcript_7128/g.20783  ORF Transcript_7128/g.20783 Transcript_7128/m.20783 type:complete len:174 (-) Transcript_7128:1097-1618(-)|eukprot:QDZ20885.1 hypothetical protein A3770_04p34030 [Chloropicon primus]
MSEVEGKLLVLREAIASALDADLVQGTEAGGERGRGAAELSRRTRLVLSQALEECERTLEQQDRDEAEIESLELERAQLELDLETLRTRLKAFEYRSKAKPFDESYHKGSPLHSKTHLSGMEPDAAARALRETMESPRAQKALRDAVDHRLDSSTMEILHLLKRLSQLRRDKS